MLICTWTRPSLLSSHVYVQVSYLLLEFNIRSNISNDAPIVNNLLRNLLSRICCSSNNNRILKLLRLAQVQSRCWPHHRLVSVCGRQLCTPSLADCGRQNREHPQRRSTPHSHRRRTCTIRFPFAPVRRDHYNPLILSTCRTNPQQPHAGTYNHITMSTGLVLQESQMCQTPVGETNEKHICTYIYIENSKPPHTRHCCNYPKTRFKNLHTRKWTPTEMGTFRDNQSTAAGPDMALVCASRRRRALNRSVCAVAPRVNDVFFVVVVVARVLYPREIRRALLSCIRCDAAYGKGCYAGSGAGRMRRRSK